MISSVFTLSWSFQARPMALSSLHQVRARIGDVAGERRGSGGRRAAEIDLRRWIAHPALEVSVLRGEGALAGGQHALVPADAGAAPGVGHLGAGLDQRLDVTA